MKSFLLTFVNYIEKQKFNSFMMMMMMMIIIRIMGLQPETSRHKALQVFLFNLIMCISADCGLGCVTSQNKIELKHNYYYYYSSCF